MNSLLSSFVRMPRATLALCVALVLLAGVAACGDDGGDEPNDVLARDTAETTGDGDASDSTGPQDTNSDDTADPTDTSTADADTAADSSTPDAPGDTADTAGDTQTCDDVCAVADGITWGCAQRFLYGINYAWHHFAGDFGGISDWGQGGVAANREVHDAALAEMRAHGVSVVRWWVWPDFRGDGVTFDANESPTGLGATSLDDLRVALELAEKNDVYLMLCLFSFDNFAPSQDVSGIWTPGLAPIVRDPAKQAALLEEVVRPFAAAAQADPNSHRLVSWDVINEPEWAMSGPSLYGDEDFAPNAELEPLTHTEMEAFLANTIAVLRDESDALITVGGAAMKWAHAWSALDIDFHQFHMYAWINTWWPYTNPPSFYGVDDRPVVMGEYPLNPLTVDDTYGEVTESWFSGGYAGAMGWMYNGATPTQLDSVKAFADAHPCETSF